MATRRLQHDFIGNDVNLSKTIKDVADESDKAADKLDKTAQSTKGLDEQMAKTSKTVAALRKEIAETGDTSLFRSLAKSENELKKLGRIKESFTRAGGDAADGFGIKFVGRIGPLLASAPISPPLIAAAAAAVPVMTTLLAGAVTGGIATGVAGIGVLIAAQDPAVQRAAEGLGDTIGAGLKDAAAPFVPATLDAISTVGAAFRQLKPELAEIFQAGAGYLEPLTDAAVGFIQNIVPGFKDAANNARPFFDMLERELPELGTDFSELITKLSEHADEGAEALGTLTDAVGLLADTIKVSTDVIGFLEKFTKFPEADKPVRHLKKVIEESVPPVADYVAELNRGREAASKLGQSATTSAQGVESLAAAIQRVTGENLSAEQSNIRLEEAIDRATEAGKRNNDGIDVNTEKGRANRQALLGIAEAAGQSYEAILAQTGSTQQASAASERGRTAFISAAEAMGVEKAEAIKLANQLFRIPDEVNTRANLDKAAAERDLKGLLTWINRIDGRSVDVTVNVRAGQRSGVGGLGGLTFSHGGAVDGPGPKGVDSVPIIAAKGEHVFTAPEVDRMGGQAAVTQFRRDLMSGQTPSAGGSGRRGGQGITEDGMYRAMVRALRTVPMSRDPGRLADMYARGG